MTPLTNSHCDFGPPPPCPARFNLAEYVLTGAGADPDKIALTIVGGPEAPVRQLTYGQLKQQVLTTAAALRNHGLEAGDRLILRIGHEIEFPIFFLAAAAIGAVPVPTSPMLSAHEARLIAEDTNARFIIAAPDAQIDEAPCSQLPPGDLRSEDQLAFVDTAADDLAYIIYTSGSSGRPKGVAHAHRAVWARRMMWDGWYGLTADDLMLHAGAFNWTYTLGAGLMDPWAIGASTLIYNGPRDPGIWSKLTRDHGATIFAAAPGVYRQFLKSDADPSDFTGLKHGLAAGETLSPESRAAWDAAVGKPIYEALGMTEVSTFLSSSPKAPHKAGTAGRPQPGRHVALLPAEGGETPTPLGNPGVISVHRSDPGLMLGYWRDEAQTSAAMRSDWFLTGDVGQMDSEGYITFLGRNDDMMNALGYRVAPEEVEAALIAHPDIQAAAAVEVRVRSDLSLIAAFIECPGEKPSDKVLHAHASGLLADYKVPKLWRFIDELPRNPNGKLQRRKLREAHDVATE